MTDLRVHSYIKHVLIQVSVLEWLYGFSVRLKVIVKEVYYVIYKWQCYNLPIVCKTTVLCPHWQLLVLPTLKSNDQDKILTKENECDQAPSQQSLGVRRC